VLVAVSLCETLPLLARATGTTVATQKEVKHAT